MLKLYVSGVQSWNNQEVTEVKNEWKEKCTLMLCHHLEMLTPHCSVIYCSGFWLLWTFLLLLLMYVDHFLFYKWPLIYLLMGYLLYYLFSDSACMKETMGVRGGEDEIPLLMIFIFRQTLLGPSDLTWKKAHLQTVAHSRRICLFCHMQKRPTILTPTHADTHLHILFA